MKAQLSRKIKLKNFAFEEEAFASIKKICRWRGLDSVDPVSIFVGWDIYGEEGRHKNARIQGKWISYKDGIFMSHSIISCQTFRVRLRTSTLHRNILSYTILPETKFFHLQSQTYLQFLFYFFADKVTFTVNGLN